MSQYEISPLDYEYLSTPQHQHQHQHHSQYNLAYAPAAPAPLAPPRRSHSSGFGCYEVDYPPRHHHSQRTRSSRSRGTYVLVDADRAHAADAHQRKEGRSSRERDDAWRHGEREGLRLRLSSQKRRHRSLSLSRSLEDAGAWSEVADERNGHRPLVKYVDERFGGVGWNGYEWERARATLEVPAPPSPLPLRLEGPEGDLGMRMGRLGLGSRTEVQGKEKRERRRSVVRKTASTSPGREVVRRERTQYPRYAKVHVLILTWSFHDLRTAPYTAPATADYISLEDETKRLRDTLEGYGYDVEEWDIPMQRSTERMCSKLRQFCKLANEDTLLMVYYHGHGSLDDNNELVFSSHEHPANAEWSQAAAAELYAALMTGDGCSHSKTDKYTALIKKYERYRPVAEVKWDDVRPIVLGAPCDLFLILDCCAAGGANLRHVNWQPPPQAEGFTKHLFAACGFESSTSDDMTAAMCEILDEWVPGRRDEKDSILTTKRLHQVMEDRLQKDSAGSQPIFKQLLPRDPEQYIVLPDLGGTVNLEADDLAFLNFSSPLDKVHDMASSTNPPFRRDRLEVPPLWRLQNPASSPTTVTIPEDLFKSLIETNKLLMETNKLLIETNHSPECSPPRLSHPIPSPPNPRLFGILLARCPEVALRDVYENLPMLQLQDLNAKDIRMYVEEFLRGQFQYLDKAPEIRTHNEIVRTVLSKASGVFLWVYLVLASLRRANRHKDAYEQILERIRQCPAELEELYKASWKRHGKDKTIYRREAAGYFKLALASYPNSYRDELSLLGFALASNSDVQGQILNGSPLPPSELVQVVDDLRRRVEICCGGFLEVSIRGVWEQYNVIGQVRILASMFLNQIIVPLSAYGSSNVPLDLSSQGRHLANLWRLFYHDRFDFVHRTAADFILNTQWGADILSSCPTSDDEIGISIFRAQLAAYHLFGFPGNRHIWDAVSNYEQYIKELGLEGDGSGMRSTLTQLLSAYERFVGRIPIMDNTTRQLRVRDFFDEYLPDGREGTVLIWPPKKLVSSICRIVADGSTEPRSNFVNVSIDGSMQTIFQPAELRLQERRSLPSGDLSRAISVYTYISKFFHPSFAGKEYPSSVSLDLIEFLIDSGANTNWVSNDDERRFTAFEWFFLWIPTLSRVSSPNAVTFKRLMCTALKFLDSKSTLSRVLLLCFWPEKPLLSWMPIGEVITRGIPGGNESTEYTRNGWSGSKGIMVMLEISVAELIHSALAWVKKSTPDCSADNLRQLDTRINQIGRGHRKALYLRSFEENPSKDSGRWFWPPPLRDAQNEHTVFIDPEISHSILGFLDKLLDPGTTAEQGRELRLEMAELVANAYAFGARVQGLMEPDAHHVFLFPEDLNSGSRLYSSVDDQFWSVFPDLKGEEADHSSSLHLFS
ncbi:hypothetical protein OQA88_5797 [Cercophora sp. LCS_1]